MKRFALLALVATAALAQTFTIPVQVKVTPTGTEVTIGTQTQIFPMPPFTPPPVENTFPPAGAFSIYKDGIMSWGGDYSFQATANYKDNSGAPATGTYDLKMTLLGAWGGFLPYAGGTVPQWNMDVSPYTKLTFDAKSTKAGQKWNVYFIKVGDVALPAGCSAAVPQAKVGDWETHVIVLSSVCIGKGLAGGTSIYKFSIQDQTGLAGNIWFLNNVGFLP
jgi:hypothetical protein